MTTTRRHTHTRGRYTKRRTPEPPKVGFVEKIITQAIICAVLFAAALVLILFKSDGTNSLTANLKDAIRLDYTPAITDTDNGLAAQWTKATDMVKTIFGFEKAVEPELEQDIPVYSETDDYGDILTDDIEEEIYLDGLYIDEDILNALRSREDVYLERNALAP